MPWNLFAGTFLVLMGINLLVTIVNWRLLMVNEFVRP